MASFTGGALLEKLGWNSLFYVPGAILSAELGLAYWLSARARATDAVPNANGGPRTAVAEAGAMESSHETEASVFRRMAWLANPCGYVALNTVIAVLPGIARRLELSTMMAGFYCSLWCFARLAAFVTLWLWTGWHYRFGWLLAAYLALVASFTTILTVPSLPVVVFAQLAFGAALGLLYYSSLFYSMDYSDTKGEHGGLHEAAIGLGNFAGPAVGATSLYFLPRSPNSSALAVSLLLLAGLGGLCAIRNRRANRR
jgi:predicted MFS family arabinose efflux permease